MTETNVTVKRRAPGHRNTGMMEPSCLFPDENEIAHCVLGPQRAKKWYGIAVVLERSGLPTINPLFGGRYWPKVKAFLDHYYLMNLPNADPNTPYRRTPSPRDGGVKPR